MMMLLSISAVLVAGVSASATLANVFSISPTSLTVNPVTNYTIAPSPLYAGKSGLDFCNVTFAYSHAGLNDTNNLWFWLPSPAQFQNRWLTTGGGGLSITSGERGLSTGLVYGAAAGTTDGGFGGFSNDLSSVLLLANGTLNYEMLFSFGYRAIHELTVLGKEFTKSYYSTSKFYSYYQGCSEGGREGFSQVQRYGSQFDGAAIGAPAFRQAFQQVLHLFSNVVEVTKNYYPSPCELEKINNDTLAACDGLDGRLDGVVSRTDLCKLQHNANASIGKKYSCDATSSPSFPGGRPSKRLPAANGTVTAEGAAVAQQIWDGLFDSKGRQAYVSFQPTATFDDAATTFDNNTGKYTATASGIGLQYVNLFLKEINSNSLPLANITYDTLRNWMLEGMQKFADTLQTTWPDLEDFHSHGAKLIHIHGESDPSIPSASSAMYYNSVRKIMYPNQNFNQSYASLQEWYKFFLVPGAAHCSPSPGQPNGPFPQNVLASVIDWVENGVDPKELNATVLDSSYVSTGIDQKLCAFPLRPLWTNNTTMGCVYDQASLDTWTPRLDSIPLPVY
ncbi:tannase and feruloyl esterase [Microthyrium microscopicum]|uniref:Carboxylic ester hydrolase n=1 Tax=Microthyrium microscopicum TaxID=703497 RepID=A0A6A6UBN7_9PEZI|nr:tannase and feruloyl esterase [Microthyrium microscopicum]